MQFDLRLLLLGMALSSFIFAADIIVSIGAISILYVILLLVTFWFAKKKLYILSSVITSNALILIGWLFQSRVTESLIDIGIVKAELDYEGLFRVFSIFILIIVGGVLTQQRSKEEELQELNENLNLRILSKTAASEGRAKRLEQQIKILQQIRKEEIESGLSGLDAVIAELKQLNELELTDE